MERRLYEAAMEGSVESLLNLLQEDALVLDRFTVSCYSETPLHIASMLGHVDFVQEILCRKPELAGELDSRKSSPLHLAAAKGYLDLVNKLVKVDPEMCFARDGDGRNPLHIAAIKGRVNVLRELVQVRPQAARVLVDQGETILHASVRYNQLEAIKLLVHTLGDYEFVNSKDNDGNTILHLAVADKQIETIKFLTNSTTIEVNALSANGLTAFDVLPQTIADRKDWEITELLRRAAAISAKDILRKRKINKTSKSQAINNQGKGSQNFVTAQDGWLKKKRSTLMVVASLIATMAFQVGSNPPGGLWQDTLESDAAHRPGYSIFAHNSPVAYRRFLAFNTTGFLASLSIILLLVSGLPLRRRIFMWILMVIMWVAITAIAGTYLFSIAVVTPPTESAALIFVLGVVVLTWIALMLTLLLGHTIRLLVRMIKYVRKLILRRQRRTSSSASASMLMSHAGAANVDNSNNV